MKLRARLSSGCLATAVFLYEFFPEVVSSFEDQTRGVAISELRMSPEILLTKSCIILPVALPATANKGRLDLFLKFEQVQNLG